MVVNFATESHVDRSIENPGEYYEYFYTDSCLQKNSTDIENSV